MRGETTIVIPVDHPAFAGHFPGTPIVPGAVLLDEAFFAIHEAKGLSPAHCRIVSAKFFHPAGPGARLTIRHETLDSGAIAFDIMEDSRKIASGSLIVTTAAGPA